MTTGTPASIRDLPPLEYGGMIAREGFAYQDHVAAGFCLEMLTNPDLKEVWCETHDDITLIWSVGFSEEVEFVQVKHVDLGQLWSPAQLCKRERTPQNPTGLGTSILERSLANDRCREACRFRMVTSQAVNRVLRVLTYPLASPGRSSDPGIATLCADVGPRTSGFASLNNHDCTYWLTNTVWQVEHTEGDLKRKNMIALLTVAAGRVALDLVDQHIYPKVLQKVKDAAEADWHVDRSAKVIRQEDMKNWFEALLIEAQYPLSAAAGSDMKRKMEEALIPPDYIGNAQDERWRYRQELLEPQYLQVSDRGLVEGEVCAELQDLRAKLDAGDVPEGLEFYFTCLRKLAELRQSLGLEPLPPLFFLHGCMHDIVDRCGHRYRRVEV